MINEKYAKRFCSEDISLIENYNEAIADSKKMWDTHHRRECDSEGRTLFTKKQLIEMDLYFKRPASELIFVTRSMHSKIHREIQHNWHSKGGKIGGKIGGGSKNAIIASKLMNSIPILQFTKFGEFVKEWPSASEAGRQLGIAAQHIRECCKGRLKSAYGFVWKYKKA